MEITKTNFEGLYIIKPKVFMDERGWFCESYSRKDFFNDIQFVQDNHSFSREAGTFRGLHFQKNPCAQAKLVRCTSGAILDIVVDLRPKSSTYKKVFMIELSKKNKLQLFIPAGFAHGFLTLEDNTEAQYKVDCAYSPTHEVSLNYRDPELGLDLTVKNISQKDDNAPFLKDICTDYTVLVTGANGLLGRDVVKELTRQKYKVLAPSKSVLDITDVFSVQEFFINNDFDCVIHCAAYTAVDRAETEREQCFKTNHVGTLNLVNAAKKKDVVFMYISTDYVYESDRIGSKKPTDPLRPLSVYGMSKLKGEQEVINNLSKYYVLRTAWLFGTNGDNFVQYILDRARDNRELRIVNDCVGSPTYTADLSKLIAQMIKSNAYGVYNAANSGSCSRYEFAKEALKAVGISADIIPISSKDYFTLAKRPKDSSLDCGKLKENGFTLLPDWKDAIKRYIRKREGKA